MSSENKTSINLYIKIIDIMPYGMIVADKNGKFILWNEKADPIFTNKSVSCTKEEWVEKFGVYHTDKVTKFKTEDLPMVRALRGETVKGERMYLTNTSNPEGMFLKVSSFPIYSDNSNEIEAAVIVIDDITQEQLLYDSVIAKIAELESYLKKHNLESLILNKNKNNKK